MLSIGVNKSFNCRSTPFSKGSSKNVLDEMSRKLTLVCTKLSKMEERVDCLVDLLKKQNECHFTIARAKTEEDLEKVLDSVTLSTAPCLFA